MLTEKQCNERNLGIGGSDVPIIFGLSSYKTPYQLYLEKTGLLETDQEKTEAQYWGELLEEKILKEFAKRNQVIVETPGTLIHPFYSFLRANIDGFIPSLNAVLEIKCSNAFRSHQWGNDGSDIIPLPYLLQVAHYCAVTDADCAYIAVLIGGNQYKEFKYDRDKAVEEKVIEAASTFWDCVQNKTPPAPVNQIDLRLMFPKHNPEKTKTINNEVAEQLTNLGKTRFEIKALNEVEEQYKFNIMQFMQDAECLVDNSGKPIISWKTNKKGIRTFLVKGLAQ